MEIVKISEIITKETKIFKLFYENNPIKYAEVDQHNYIIIKKFFVNMATLSHLEFLSLRGNQLDNDFAIEFV